MPGGVLKYAPSLENRTPNRLFRLAVQGVSPAARAEFFEFKTLRVVTTALGCRVIALFTFRAGHRCYDADVLFGHILLPLYSF
jgi:hypothetical protein